MSEPTPRPDFFLSSEDDEMLEQALITEVDRAMGRPERRVVAEDTVILREGEPVNEIFIRLEGKVRLTRRSGEHDVTFHERSTGRIIGLMSLAQRQRAHFTCRAASEVTLIPLPLSALEAALQASACFASLFIAVLLRSLATRTRHVADLELQLIESEKMATLGQLSAGIAHELNSPVTAIARGAHHIGDVLLALVRDRSDGALLAEVMQEQMTRPPLPTREARARRRALTESFGDEELARRLVEIGFATEEEVKTRLGAVGATQLTTHLDRLEAPARIGRSLRNVLSGAERITGLVGSLRSFARPEREAVEGVDVNATLEDSLALLGHALREVKVVREYGEVSRITCQVGALGQVWTNLISNALQAMGGTGTLQLVTESPAPDNVAVHIIDSGPGISPEDIEQIFDLNFTTRQGPADFGLGLGLPISRDIVARHGGAIAVDSKPGRTCFTVTLPVNGGAALKEREDAQP